MYNTGNPLGSTSPKDFSDNSEITDSYVNDVVNETTRDRFGRSRLTIHGIEKKADTVFASVGFFVPVDYTSGLTVDNRNFTVIYNGVVYAAQPSSVPFTTGVWDAAQWYPIQNVLNQKNLLVFDTYGEASAAAATLPDGQVVDVESEQKRYRAEGGVLVFVANLDQLRIDLLDVDKGGVIRGAAVGYKEYTTVSSLADASVKDYPVGTKFILLPTNVKFEVSNSPPQNAGVFSYELQAGKFAVAVNTLPIDRIGVFGALQEIDCPILSTYLSVQNALYDETNQWLILTHPRTVAGGEIGAFTVYSFNGVAVGSELFRVTDVPAGHFSYTALQRKGNDLWLWFQYYTAASSTRGIGRIKVEIGATAELMIPDIASGSSHSVLMLGSYGTEGVWLENVPMGTRKQYLSFNDMESGLYNPRPLDDKDLTKATGRYLYQTQYESAGDWNLLTGMFANASRNDADAEWVNYDSATDTVRRWPLVLSEEQNPSRLNLEPQAVFSRWNGYAYDIYMVSHNMTTPTRPAIFQINAVGANAAPVPTAWLRPDWRSANWSKSITPPYTQWRDYVPVLETDRSIVTPGIFIGGNNAGDSKSAKADPTLFRLTQTFGGVEASAEGRRELYELVCGYNEVVLGWIANHDSIFSAQESLVITHLNPDGVSTMSTRRTFSPTFGQIIGGNGRVTRNNLINGIGGVYKNGAYSSINKTFGYSFAAAASGSMQVAFGSYLPIGMGLDVSVGGGTQGLKFGMHTTAPETDQSTVTSITEWYRMVASAFHSAADNSRTLGTAAMRWSVVYAGTGAINTSDQREKTNLEHINDAVLDAWGDVQLICFQWLNSVQEKGEDVARWHFGVIAQQVRDAFSAHGLDGTRYGLLCYDEWQETPSVLDNDGNVTVPAQQAGNRWGIRADQCLFLEAAYQRRRAERIEARLTAIEAKL